MKAFVGEQASTASRALGARAFASGDSVAFDGAPDLHTAAHEAAHVIQQRGGITLANGMGRAGATMPNRETKWTSSITPGGIKRMLVPAPFEKAVTAILEEKGFHLPFPLKFVPLTEGEVKVHFHELELTVKAPDYASDLATEKQIFYTHIMRIE